MKTFKQVKITTFYTDLIPDELEENTVYISEEYECAIHLCLCGCNKKTVTPFKEGDWAIKYNILNSSMNCKSKYIISNNIANFV